MLLIALTENRITMAPYTPTAVEIAVGRALFESYDSNRAAYTWRGVHRYISNRGRYCKKAFDSSKMGICVYRERRVVCFDPPAMAATSSSNANPIGSRKRSSTEYVSGKAYSRSISHCSEHVFSAFGIVLFPRDILLPAKTNIPNTIRTMSSLNKN